ncbi:MAG TPA: HupE/UreJ family protein [Polyangiales bacterium]|nr:HupE/UreJ family protein [Polyangiales bacterium]
MKIVILLLSLWPAVAQAHKPSDSYLTLDLEGASVRGQWDVALRDLDRALQIDDGDGVVHGRELLAADLSRALAQVHVPGCALSISGAPKLIEHSDGAYARIGFAGACKDAPQTLQYDFFFALDPQHRAVVHNGEHTFVLTARERSHDLHTRGSLVADGIWHILSGLDHVLFLLALLLPSVLRRDALRPLLADVLRVVTAFTVAHSLTLALAALGLVRMSAAWIEPAIAASVALAALDNVVPIFGGGRASLAFALGLLHGFGFSSALSDLGLSGAALLRGLVSFNVGVELGQLGLIALFLPVAYLARNTRWLMRSGSLAIAAVALVWFAQRVTGG